MIRGWETSRKSCPLVTRASSDLPNRKENKHPRVGNVGQSERGGLAVPQHILVKTVTWYLQGTSPHVVIDPNLLPALT